MKDDPIFVLDVTRCNWYNPNKIDPIKAFKEIESKYKIIIFSPKVQTEICQNIILLKKDNLDFEVNVSAKNIYNNIIKLYV